MIISALIVCIWHDVDELRNYKSVSWGTRPLDSQTSQNILPVEEASDAKGDALYGEALYNMGRNATASGDYSRALLLFDQAAVAYQKIGQLIAARQDIDQYLLLEPNDSTGFATYDSIYAALRAKSALRKQAG